MKFETGKTYEVVKAFDGLSVGMTLTVDGVTHGINWKGDLVRSDLGWATTVAFKGELACGYLKEVKTKMKLDEIVNSKETFVIVTSLGNSLMYHKGMLGGNTIVNGGVVAKIHKDTGKDYLVKFAKEIYRADDYPNGDPVWTAESEEDARKREQLEKLGKDIEVLTESYNKLKDELK